MRFYHADILGSVVALTDSTGAVTTRYSYTPFGLMRMEGEQIGQPFGFTGHQYDGETGMLYMRARYYAPDMGRFITEDPLGFGAGDVNFYAYVGNNPVNYTDPLGLEVYLCSREAEIAWGLVDHHWIKTDTKEAGMGPRNEGVPGENYDFFYLTLVSVNDHTGESMKPGATCELIEDVDEDKVNSLITAGRSLGWFTPFNNCQSFAAEVLKQSSTKKKSLISNDPQVAPILHNGGL